MPINSANPFMLGPTANLDKAPGHNDKMSVRGNLQVLGSSSFGAMTPRSEPVTPQLEPRSPPLEPPIARIPISGLTRMRDAHAAAQTGGGVHHRQEASPATHARSSAGAAAGREPTQSAFSAEHPPTASNLGTPRRMPSSGSVRAERRATVSRSSSQKMSSGAPLSASQQSSVSTVNTPRKMSSISPTLAEQLASVSNVRGRPNMPSVSLPLQVSEPTFGCTRMVGAAAQTEGGVHQQEASPAAVVGSSVGAASRWASTHSAFSAEHALTASNLGTPRRMPSCVSVGAERRATVSRSSSQKMSSGAPLSANQQASVSIVTSPRRMSSVSPTPAKQLASVPNVSSTPRNLNVSLPLPVSEQLPLRLVIFDFDCTLTVYHVFDSLAGTASSSFALPVPPPHALSELGQMLRLAELDTDSAWGPAGFALEAFGGATRVAQLHKALQSLVDDGVECIICSRGMVGPIRKCLDQVNLLAFFKHVFGNLGNATGSTNYDNKAGHTVDPMMVQHYLGSADMDVRGSGAMSKAETIAKYIKDRRLKFNQVMYFDDQIDEIRSAADVCRVELVRGGNVCAAIKSLKPSLSFQALSLQHQRKYPARAVACDLQEPDALALERAFAIADASHLVRREGSVEKTCETIAPI